MTGLSAQEAEVVWSAAVRSAKSTTRCTVSSQLVARALQSFKSSSTLRLTQATCPIQLQSASTQWYTPPSILSLVRQVFEGGTIDLDPCSNKIAQRTVAAGHYFSHDIDGLKQPWFGKVYVNPPFGQVQGKSQQGLFLSKSISEYQAGRVSEAVFLLKAAVGYAWFSQAMQFPHAFLKSLVAFHSVHSEALLEPSQPEAAARTANPHGSVVVYLGPNEDQLCAVFSRIAFVPGVNAWAARS